MNKKLTIFIVLLIGVLSLIAFLTKTNPLTGTSMTSSSNSDNLYDIAVKYIIDNNDNDPEKDNDRYKMFTEYNKFGIYKDKDYRYVYMWIIYETYYVVNNKIISGSGASMPYKFTFELNNDKVVKYEIPKDSPEYESSIREMYPDDIENKVFNYSYDDTKLINEVKEYYSDLKDTNIYFIYDNQYIKLK